LRIHRPFSRLVLVADDAAHLDGQHLDDGCLDAPAILYLLFTEVDGWAVGHEVTDFADVASGWTSLRRDVVPLVP
jgi:hypothetical protein